MVPGNGCFVVSTFCFAADHPDLSLRFIDVVVGDEATMDRAILVGYEPNRQGGTTCHSQKEQHA